MNADLAVKLRSEIYPTDVLLGQRPPTLAERTKLVSKCVESKLSIFSAAQVVAKTPVSPKDKNWRGRALEAYLGGQNRSGASRDFEDGELKSTRVLGEPGNWRIEQTLRIRTLSHTSGDHRKVFERTPFYDKISCFTCVMFDSEKNDINSGHFVGTFLFRITDHENFLPQIREDYEFYLRKAAASSRISSKIKSPHGFLGCRQTAGVAGVVSATSLYITPVKFNELLTFYGVNNAP